MVYCFGCLKSLDDKPWRSWPQCTKHKMVFILYKICLMNCFCFDRYLWVQKMHSMLRTLTGIVFAFYCQNSFWCNLWMKIKTTRRFSNLEIKRRGKKKSYLNLTIDGTLISTKSSQCARMDLNKRFLPKPMTTTAWKRTP